ncbi:hypothetical protein HHI36_020275 [Cryptolaemus montrouzieri]|uniref:Uncharacterized protein n=1 Tax=Cryptolaemus montrouzieri TaxID=559131 RepID=A0ABD2NBG4_9CUCU
MNVENGDSIQRKGRHRKKQLYSTILQQMEFYFSDSNLSKDRYLSKLIQEDPYIDISVFMRFNKIRKLTESIDDLRKAISKSEILEISEDTQKVRRNTPIKVKENEDDCTIYVERISSDANHEFLSAIFSDFGSVAYVSIPKYKHNQMNKGFAFIEFDTKKEAENTLNYFESIGCKMSSNINPEDLCSISTFLKESQMNTSDDENSSTKIKSQKRKLSEDDEEPRKKMKNDIQVEEVGTNEEGDGKKKKKKEHKKKNLIKELGLQILSKYEWKKMRNSYLNLQRKKMKEVKMHLTKSKYSKQNWQEKNIQETENSSKKGQELENSDEKPPKPEYIPGTIVRVKLPEPCQSDKKIKMEIKAAAKDVKYVDVPLSSGSEEVFVRFATSEAAQKFCSEELPATKDILEGEEEKQYWKRIENDRLAKFQKSKKKQRGKDKLLKKAEKHLAKHTRFDENE